MEDIDLTLVDAAQPVPLGVSLAWVVVVDYSRMFPSVAVRLQMACNNGENITLLP